MKKWLMFLMAILILAGCGQTTNKQKKTKPLADPPIADVIIHFKGVNHIERLNRFMENMQNGKSDKVRLIRYTIEGDPIYQLLNYDGKTLFYTLDNTHDNYSSSEDRKKITYKCQRINRQETNTITNYSLEGCPTLQNAELFTINHDINKEDYFAFQLKYGKYNVIDTSKRELSMKLSNGDVVVVKDFQLPTSMMNDIYKDMIFADYLGDKRFSSQCQSKTSTEYEFRVWINSGERHFQWFDCDQSPDGKKMTRLANEIISRVQDTSVYKKILN